MGSGADRTLGGLLLRCGKDVADIGVGAVCGIKAMAACDENVEFCFERGQVLDACAHVDELVVDQCRDMSTGDVAVDVPRCRFQKAPAQMSRLTCTAR